MANMAAILQVMVVPAMMLRAATGILDRAASRIIERDVVILGGGGSGAHTAVMLRKDFNKSIIIVEKQTDLVRQGDVGYM
jgi:ribulose 1,5-bisphosphate synthetase/thiazole synthase